ncbi:uncharacterized protein LOC128724064 [Anopheles nili]|uniref:uncharacterized protein LOC128724064 n=1 Tax=Anopheles nili TaxID=185578 RepID=UPI00237C12EF|nr:uncharacterized protein LOC128724064 [Anopheles nili]
MDHLEHLSGSINGQQDALSKGIHRSSMQAGENGSIHFVEMTHNGREQEYIESSLLGTDLLSSQLPTNLLNDYINSVSTAGTNSMSGIQSTIIEHNYRSFNTDELHALDNESNNEATDMINGNKDIPGFNTLSSYEKIINGSPSTSQINANGLAQIAGIDGYVHFPLSSTLHANGGSANDGFDMVSSVGLVASESHSHQEQLQQLQYNLSHHQHSGPGHLNHHQNIVELSNTGSQQLALIQHQLQQQPHQRHSHHSLIEEQSKASINITIPTLSPVDVPMKLYAHSNSIIPSTSSASGQNDIYNSPKLSMASLKSNKSEKRFYSCTTLPSLITHSQQRISFPAVESLITSKNSRTSTIDCESRLHEQVIAECVASIESASGFLGNINLPHKKRLAKKIGDARECTSNGNPDMDQTSILAFDQCSQRHASISTSIQLPSAMSTRQQLSIQRNNKALHSNESANSSLKIHQPSATISQPSSDPFCCRVCGEIIQDQLLFFKHLKHHYEPSATDKNTAAVVNIVTIKAATNEIPLDTADGKKAKPKLPRVKHTKKLKNDRTVRHNELDEKNQHTKGDSKAVVSLKPPDTSSKDVNNILLPSNAVIGLECSENGGEFSETEDMLEGIRNVVQKVQETVDTDMNEELILANNTSWRFPAVLEGSDIQTSGNTTTTLTEKEMPLVGDGLEDTSEIHIQNGGENYLLFLSKSQFNDTEMLHSTAHDLPLIGKPLEKLTHTLNDNNVNEQASDEQEIVQIQNPHLPGSGELHYRTSLEFTS